MSASLMRMISQDAPGGGSAKRPPLKMGRFASQDGRGAHNRMPSADNELATAAKKLSAGDQPSSTQPAQPTQPTQAAPRGSVADNGSGVTSPGNGGLFRAISGRLSSFSGGGGNGANAAAAAGANTTMAAAVEPDGEPGLEAFGRRPSSGRFFRAISKSDVSDSQMQGGAMFRGISRKHSEDTAAMPRNPSRSGSSRLDVRKITRDSSRLKSNVEQAAPFVEAMPQDQGVQIGNTDNLNGLKKARSFKAFDPNEVTAALLKADDVESTAKTTVGNAEARAAADDAQDCAVAELDAAAPTEPVAPVQAATAPAPAPPLPNHAASEHSAHYMRIKASKINEYSAPAVVMAEYPHPKHWAVDLFSWPHNAMRQEIIELYQMLSSMNRMYLDLERDDIDALFDWLDVFFLFLEEYWQYEAKHMVRKVESRGMMEKEVVHERLRLRALVAKGVSTLRNNRETKYEFLPAGEALKDIRRTLNKTITHLFEYFRLEVRKYAKTIETKTAKKDWVNETQRMVLHFMNGKQPAMSSQILFRWMEDKKLQMQLIRSHCMNLPQFSGWSKTFHEKHSYLVGDLYRRSEAVIIENAVEVAERVPRNYVMAARNRDEYDDDDEEDAEGGGDDDDDYDNHENDHENGTGGRAKREENRKA